MFSKVQVWGDISGQWRIRSVPPFLHDALMRLGNGEDTVTLKCTLWGMNVGLCTVEWALIRSNIWTFFSAMEEEPLAIILTPGYVYMFVPTLELSSLQGKTSWGSCRIYVWVSLLAVSTWITQVMLPLTGHMMAGV